MMKVGNLIAAAAKTARRFLSRLDPANFTETELMNTNQDDSTSPAESEASSPSPASGPETVTPTYPPGVGKGTLGSERIERIKDERPVSAFAAKPRTQTAEEVEAHNAAVVAGSSDAEAFRDTDPFDKGQADQRLIDAELVEARARERLERDEIGMPIKQSPKVDAFSVEGTQSLFEISRAVHEMARTVDRIEKILGVTIDTLITAVGNNTAVLDRLRMDAETLVVWTKQGGND